MTAEAKTTQRSNSTMLYVAFAVVVVLVAGVIFWATRDDDDVVAGDDTTTTTEPETTTTEPETTTTEPETTTTTQAATEVDARTAVFPFAEDSVRFDDPLEAVEAFAEGYLGFVDPVYSEFRQGDSRSGEVGVRPIATGPETTVLVRQFEDDTWWILGAGSSNIVVTEPAAGDVLVSPVTLSGEALAFEGTVNVELWTDRADEPLAMTFVTGGGDVLRPFEGTLTFDGTPATESGALLFREYGGEDGNVWQAAVVRVHFP
ncbi:MAG: Gmad2 immunoglobulin-like domain-containing protein [Acidimicrobiales bacterium]